MSLLVYQLVQDYLPMSRKKSAKGWWQFNAICCHHRGHSQDTRGRGNLLLSTDGSIIYNCYNCGFKTGYKGNDISDPFKSFLTYLNVPEEKINSAKLEILDKRIKGELSPTTNINWIKPDTFSEIVLPENAQPIENVVDSKILPVIKYLGSRGNAITTGYQYYWSTSSKWNLNKRLIIPFLYQNKIVGWTARYAGIPPKDIPRYFTSDVSNGYIFNCDVLSSKTRKYILICEGPFDAIAINGVGALGSKLNQSQIAWLNSIDVEKIVVPDRQRKNQNLIDTAIEENWSVSFPDWEVSIKDAAEASTIYGKLYTIYSIIHSRTNSELQIDFKRKLFKG